MTGSGKQRQNRSGRCLIGLRGTKLGQVSNDANQLAHHALFGKKTFVIVHVDRETLLREENGDRSLVCQFGFMVSEDLVKEIDSFPGSKTVFKTDCSSEVFIK